MSNDTEGTSNPVPPGRETAVVRGRKGRWFLRALVVLVVLGAIGLGTWFAFFRTVRDPDGAIASNNRGVAEMEQFQYANAADAFRESMKKDPDWLVPRINLAIAILNVSEGNDPQVATLLQEVLAKQPDDLHANYTLGFFLKHRGELDAAYPYFDRVSQLDPNDAYTWLHKGICHPDGEDSPAGLECFRTAIRLDPYLNAARYKLFGLARAQERQGLLEELQRLQSAFWEHQYSPKYTDQGPYAQVIGRTRDSHPPQPAGPLPAFDPWEKFRVQLAPGTRWANAADLGDGPTGDIFRKVRDRFGATLVLFDYDRDGRPDLYLLSAVVRARKVGNLLLRNSGDGEFVDVTNESGLGEVPPSFGCAVADFDNDDLRDLLITGPDGVRLMRNAGAGRFTDVSSAAGLSAARGVYLASGWADLDQDCDLDLVICRLSDTVETAIDALGGKKTETGQVEVWFNRGDAPAVAQGQRQPPLRPAFERAAGQESIQVRGTCTGILFSDLDADNDVDVLLLRDSQAPTAVRNDRLLRFSNMDGSLVPPASWVGGAVLDVNHDGRSDIALLSATMAPQILLSTAARIDGPIEHGYVRAATNAPPMKHATCIDVDSDGWTDLVGLSSDRTFVFLHNDGENRLPNRAQMLAIPLPDDLLSVTSSDLDGDCFPDILGWSESLGLRAFRGQNNGNKSIRFELSGRYEQDRTRTNADGIGCRVVAQAGRLWTGMENTTLSAGLGQSRIPLTLGIGRASVADALRIIWPDATYQALVNVATCELHAIQELNRKPTSCPVLLVWNGERFQYVTDFLGAGALGELGPDGSLRQPRPEESVKIEPGLMVARDGQIVLKITEPMDELLYLDRVQLIAIDHSKDVEVHPDERFVVAGPPATQELLAFHSPVAPVRALDHKGRDVTEILAQRDRNYVSHFARRSWLGYAEEHFVELDFEDRLAHHKPGDRLFLVLGGWTDYAYPESIYAATQAGVPTVLPTLERREPDGTWKTLGELGFPAGLPRVMTREITGLVTGPTCRLRIRTNLSVYWDRIVVASVKSGDPTAIRTTMLDPRKAILESRGFLQEVRPGGAVGPVEYDGTRTETVAVTPWRGQLTRFGDVTELLHKDDDCFVLCGPGEEVTIAFDATRLPPVVPGSVRSFVLRTWGYCKDTAPTTESGGQVEPLPFRGMKNYPRFTADERRRADALQGEYRKKWNIRTAAGGPK